jgi:hypothetical protein
MPSIARLLPLPGKDYQRKRIKLGIIRRVREIKTPADLMTLRLFHPLNGVPLAAVGTAASALKIGNFSDAAFMKKFAECGEWFKHSPDQSLLALCYALFTLSYCIIRK